MTGRSRPELLAPAGGMQALRAAVENGADAVYLGGKSFGARASADNFTREELYEALAYAHGRGVRVYVTVNTLVDNEEFGELSDFLFFLYGAGADALLVQDLGVIAWIRAVLPGFPLHGSTQMTVHNAAGVQYLAGLGLQRVVLARETTYQELLSIKSSTDLELEVFVHGALCISYSGQCLFSSMVGGRSGNRGSCAQPCRLAYTLVDERGGELGGACPGQHLLSTKDLMLLRELPSLIASGVAALKIEGRMKRPEYVATVVRIYRAALDRACADPGHYEVSGEEIRDLAQAFNRGFTNGYFAGNPGQALMSFTRPNNRGLYLGRVLRAEPGRALIKTVLPLKSGDGIEFWTQKGQREGITVHGMNPTLAPAPGSPPAGAEAEAGSEVELCLPFAVRPGDRVFKTHDERLNQEARRSFMGPGRRLIPISVCVTARLGEPLAMAAVDATGLRVAVRGRLAGERALKHPLTPEVAHAQMERLGNTPFTLSGLECDLDGEAMYPLSEINAVRRDLTAALEAARLEQFRRSPPEGAAQAETAFWLSLRQMAASRRTISSSGRGGRLHERHSGGASVSPPPAAWPLLAVAVSDEAGLQSALAGGTDVVYFGGLSYQGRDAWSPGRTAAAVERCRAAPAAAVITSDVRMAPGKVGARGATGQARPYLIVPRIWKDGDRPPVAACLDAAASSGAGVLVGDLGGLALALQAGLEIVTDLSIPVFNDAAALLLLQQGAGRLTLSPELNREQLQRLAFRATPHLELIVHGTMPLMVSEHCPLGAQAAGGKRCPQRCRRGACFLKDRQGYRFPLQFDEHCRMTLYNARELCLIEHLDDIIQDGYGAIRLELRFSEAKRVLGITKIYREACDRIRSGDWTRSAGRQAWEQLDQLSTQGLTRGHYLRGVLRPASETGGQKP